MKGRQKAEWLQTITDKTTPEDSLQAKYAYGKYADISVVFREIPKAGLGYTERDKEGRVYWGEVTIDKYLLAADDPRAKTILLGEFFQAFTPSPRDASKTEFPEYQYTFFADDVMEKLPTDWGNGPKGIVNYMNTSIPVEVLKATLKYDFYGTYGNGVKWSIPTMTLPDTTIN